MTSLASCVAPERPPPVIVEQLAVVCEPLPDVAFDLEPVPELPPDGATTLDIITYMVEAEAWMAKAVSRMIELRNLTKERSK
jgi:hypothetical protein